MSGEMPSPGEEEPEPEERGPLYAALVGLVLVLAVGRLVGGRATEVAAGLVLLGVPLVALSLPGRNRTLLLLAGAAGAWALERTGPVAGTASLPLLILQRTAYFAVPPLLLALALSRRDRSRLGLGPAHLYAPAVVMGLGGLVHLAFNWRAQGPGPEVRVAAAFYGGCYALLIGVALILRLRRASAPQAKPVTVSQGVDLEEQGRFGLAARAYEREGDPRKAAEMAARAGDWSRAARLYRLVEADYDAGEMYYRAGMLPEALRSYERAGDLAAAARLSLELGKVDEAVALHEQAGDWAGVVGALEASGRRPTVEQYRKAGLFRKAAETLEETGQWQRAGEMYEHEVGDVARATAAYLKGGAGVQAGRLLEAEGRREEALLAFSAVPAGAADAARLHLDAGRPNDAAAVFAQVPTTEIEKLDDEPTLTRVAAFLVDSGRNLEAVRLLQVVKRRGPAGGRAHLLLGRALHARQLPELAEQELRSALGMPLEPADRQQAEYRLACLLEEAGRGPEALPLFQAILERELSYADVQERYRRLKASGTAENARA